MISNKLCCVVTTFLICIQFSTSIEAVPTVRNGEHQKEIFCHYVPDNSFLNITKIITNSSQCNHNVYYGQVKSNGEIELFDDAFQAIETDRHIQISREKGIRASIAITMNCGYYEKRFSTENIGSLVQSIIELIKRRQLDGLMIQVDDVKDTLPLLGFVRQLSKALKPHGFLLTVQVLSEFLANPDFDVHALSNYVDWILPLGIEQSRKKTKLLAPLYSNAGDARPELSTNWTVSYLLEKGVPSEKIVLTVYTLVYISLFSSEENVLNVPEERIRSNSSKDYMFPSVCSKVKNDNLTVVHDKRVGTYAYSTYSYINRFFAAYYDVEDAYSLGRYIGENNLGGGSILAFNFDDVNNECGCGELPILNGLVQGLRNVTVGKAENCT